MEGRRRPRRRPMEDVVREAMEKAFKEGDSSGYWMLSAYLEDQPDKIIHRFSPEHVEKAIQHANQGNSDAAEFLLHLLEARPDLFTPEHIEKMQKHIELAIDAVSKGRLIGIGYLQHALRKHFDLFRPEHIEKLQKVIKRAAESVGEGNERAYDLLSYLLSARPDLVVPYLSSEHIETAIHHTAWGNESARSFLGSVMTARPQLITPRHFQELIEYADEGNRRILKFLLGLAWQSPEVLAPQVKAALDLASRRGGWAYSFLGSVLERHPDLVLNQITPEHLESLMVHVGDERWLDAENFLKEIFEMRPDLFTPEHTKKAIELIAQGKHSVFSVLEKMLKVRPELILPHRSLLLSVADRLNNYETGMKLVSFAYELGKFDRKIADQIIERAMHTMYRMAFGKQPPKPAHPSDLPLTITHPEFRGGGRPSGEQVRIPIELKERLKRFGISIDSVYEIHDALDRLTFHWYDILKNLTKNVPEEKRQEFVEHLEKERVRTMVKLERIASRINTDKVILEFNLSAVPKRPYDYVHARITASNDCTVPTGPAFVQHTVPTYFSSNAATYRILATHLDRTKDGRQRVRKNRHVGNVYVSIHTTKDGRKILYVHGVQLGTIYRGVENLNIVPGLVKGLIDTARKQGFDEVWVHRRGLSNYMLLESRIAEEFEKRGAVGVDEKELDALHYGDLPKIYYASPHFVGHEHLLKLRVKNKTSR